MKKTHFKNLLRVFYRLNKKKKRTLQLYSSAILLHLLFPSNPQKLKTQGYYSVLTEESLCCAVHSLPKTTTIKSADQTSKGK